MATNLDRDGIFKAVPIHWSLRDSATSKAVFIAIEYQILEFLDGGAWQDWRAYDKQTVDGWHCVVKGDGTPNTGTCEQLAESLGWSGSLAEVAQREVPQCLVQITVKSEDYKGTLRRRAEWLNRGDHQPSMDQDEVKSLDASYGSLLRAVASSKRKEPVPLPGAEPEKAPAKAPPSKPAAPAHVAKAPPSQPEAGAVDYSNIPFALLLALPLLLAAF